MRISLTRTEANNDTLDELNANYRTIDKNMIYSATLNTYFVVCLYVSPGLNTVVGNDG